MSEPPRLPRMMMPHFEPKVGDQITIDLPDERTRGEIVKVVSTTAVIAKLLTFLTASRSHSYRKGDIVPCLYAQVGMNQNGWRAVSEREMEAAARAQEEAERVAAQEQAQAPAAPSIPEMTEADL